MTADLTAGLPLQLAQAAKPADSVSGDAGHDDVEKARVESTSALLAVIEEVQSTYEYFPAILLGMVAVAGVVTLLFWNLAPPAVLLGWLAAFAGLWLTRAWMFVRYRRGVGVRAVNWTASRRTWNITTLASGALWGATAWVFYPLGSSEQQTGLILVLYTYSICAIPVLAHQPRLFLGFAALCFVPMIGRIASDGSGHSNYQLAGEMLLIVGLTTVLSRSYQQALQRVTELKLRADGLLEQLRQEKLAADAARHEAEVANRAKTQFFTAASHDLRQPLHAMGLFAEALRRRAHDPEVAQLVNSINESVDALEGLFSELLDMSRIDSGGVEVKPRDFVLGDVFRKLKLHFEPAAFEKGLALRFRGSRRAVRADPLLVERILRNLVSNAIRYADDGSVLVSARPRAGSVLLQVWDTGVGIGEDQQDRVFEEFYQVPGQREPSAEQRKGLGLGLAIVHRLARLMDAPLSLRSVPGRGTVFTLELPLGDAQFPVLEVALPPRTAGITLDGRLILVVEDEPAVRGGLEALLASWGASFLSFDSVSAVESWVESADSAAAHPALAIVDYRLEAQRTGVDAIAALRLRFGAALPAIVVTGSNMLGHEPDAHKHDFHVLIKPVLPNKLRAMISFKLGSEHKLKAEGLRG